MNRIARVCEYTRWQHQELRNSSRNVLQHCFAYNKQLTEQRNYPYPKNMNVMLSKPYKKLNPHLWLLCKATALNTKRRENMKCKKFNTQFIYLVLMKLDINRGLLNWGYTVFLPVIPDSDFTQYVSNTWLYITIYIASKWTYLFSFLWFIWWWCQYFMPVTVKRKDQQWIMD